ncbi:hypothetical protein BT96DRAFT_758942, partial [Gymnopus androsaceus JB14]
ENMVDVVWNTLEKYGLIGWVLSLMMDNVSNNDTLTEAIECKCHALNIPFKARHACLQRMPHTVHLAILKLLEAIGAMEKDSKKNSQPYQDAVA